MCRVGDLAYYEDLQKYCMSSPGKNSRIYTPFLFVSCYI